ncbi:MAG TPA: oligopeptide:H+ symporter [Thermoguttaceae bacterium]
MQQTNKSSPATPETAVHAEKSSLFDHPLGFWFFFWGEFAERCSYYGMRAILLLYMIDRLNFSAQDANRIMSFFIAGCYLLPLVGGYVADNYLGKYRTIVIFSLPYVIGQLIIGIENRWFLLLALSLLAMGSGVIKPNISTLMGLTYDQQRPGRLKLRSDAFALFYGSINIGAAISSFAVPALRNAFGYQKAFLFPAVLMALALLAFASGKRFYATETIERVRLSAEDRRQRFIILRRIIGLFIVVTFFWSIFDQSASTWTLFARDHLNLNVFDHPEGTWQWRAMALARDYLHVDLFGYQLAPDQIQGLNPILIVLLLPPITIFWHVLYDIGIKLRPTDKMLIGFILTTITMGIMAVAGYRSAELGRVSVLWEVIPYILITIAEICISVVGLELAFSAAPASMKSFVTACWLLTVFFGNMINSVITPLYDVRIDWLGITLSPGNYFALFAFIMIPVTLAFVFVSRRFNRSVT